MLTNEDKAIWKAWVDKFMNTKLEIISKWSTRASLSTRLDLHGMTVQDAYNAVYEFLEQHSSLKTKKVHIVTGKSGMISKEFKTWVSNMKFVRRIEPIHDKKGGIGSYNLWLS
jgi:DNA-nicking Smr family endonuclease